MAKSVKLLLTENVEALGIVGDVVNVRVGYARNFLLPRSLATTPSDELVKQLASKRAAAEKELAHQRSAREELIGKLQGVEIAMVKSCNDQGILYAAITQQEIAKSLSEKGFGIKPRDVRLHEVIKRVGGYDVHIKLDSDLDAHVKLKIDPDRELDNEKGEPVAAASGERKHDALAAAMAAEAEAASKGSGWGAKKAESNTKGDGDKPAKGDKPKAEKKPAKGEEKKGKK